MNILLSLGAEDVQIADLSLRMYAGTQRLLIDALELRPTITGVDYALLGIPDAAGITITYEMPLGVGFSWSSPVAPAVVIVPLREAGRAGDLDLVLFRDEAVAGESLTVTELGDGSEPGDYAVAGWDGPGSGKRYVLRWQIDGIYYTRSWEGAPAQATGLFTYEDDDYAYIRNLFEGWTPSPLPSPNWIGIVQENSALLYVDPRDGLEKGPSPTGKTQAPTVYAAWTLDIDDTEGDFEGLQAPCRWGRLTVAVYTEPDSRKGPIRKFRQALRRLLDAENEGSLDFDVQNAQVIRVGYVGPWYVENFVCPVVGA